MTTKKIRNRRKGPDALIKTINYLALVSWIFIFTIFILISIAKPAVEGFFDRQYGISVSNTWDTSLLEYSFYLMFILLIIGLIGLYINTTRHQRKTDRYNKSLILSVILSFIGILYYLFIF
ncbi:MAG: hypothetical protein SVR08_00340 [Spirochaetota bacterium]|nr:hypothetical protein [Spirochaetota bacterium]